MLKNTKYCKSGWCVSFLLAVGLVFLSGCSKRDNAEPYKPKIIHPNIEGYFGVYEGEKSRDEVWRYAMLTRLENGNYQATHENVVTNNFIIRMIMEFIIFEDKPNHHFGYLSVGFIDEDNKGKSDVIVESGAITEIQYELDKSGRVKAIEFIVWELIGGDSEDSKRAAERLVNKYGFDFGSGIFDGGLTLNNPDDYSGIVDLYLDDDFRKYYKLTSGESVKYSKISENERRKRDALVKAKDDLDNLGSITEIKPKTEPKPPQTTQCPYSYYKCKRQEDGSWIFQTTDGKNWFDQEGRLLSGN